MGLREILARREAIRLELRGIIDKHPDGLPDEARGRADELEAEANRLNDQERRQVLIDELDRRAAGSPVGGGADASFDKLAGEVSLLDTVRAQLPGATDLAAGRAREVSQELARRAGRKPEGLFYSGARTEQRVFTTTTPGGGPGSNLIQTDVGPLIDRLRERLVIRALGATILSDLNGPLSLPRLKASATAYWVAENAAVTASDPQTDSVPMNMKTVGGLVEISRQILLQSSLDVSRMVEDDLAKILAVAIDTVAIGVTTPVNQPSGLLTTGSGITIVAGGTNGLAPSWDNLVALIAAVDTSNALTGSLSFLGNAKVASKLRRTLRTTADTSSSFILGDAGSLAGYGFTTTQLVPSNLVKGTSGAVASALIFGNWADLVVGFWGPSLDILINPYETVAYSKGNIQIRALASCDVAIKQPLSFAAITDLLTV